MNNTVLSCFTLKSPEFSAQFKLQRSALELGRNYYAYIFFICVNF